MNLIYCYALDRLSQLLGLAQKVEERLFALVDVFPQIPSFAAMHWGAAGVTVDGLETWIEKVKTSALLPALISSLEDRNELAGFATYDFPLFLAARVPGGDTWFVEWAHQDGMSLFYLLNEAAAQPEPVASLTPRAFRPR